LPQHGSSRKCVATVDWKGDASIDQRVAAGHEFDDVDRTGRPAAFVRYLDERGALEFFQLLERQMAHRLAVTAGGRYLDVGCGTGDDVRGLARLVVPGGEVVGIDSSEAMVAEATRRAEGTGLPVAFRRGDAHHLEFADGAFDGCRVRRVLTHLAEPQRAVAEMARVTRPGGRVVAYEADWETFVLDAADRAVLNAGRHDQIGAIEARGAHPDQNFVRRRRRLRRQERERVDVPLSVRGYPHAEVHVRLGDARLVARAVRVTGSS